ncbi:MAG TPA: DUF3237 domain-containing protein [Alphaproteobacteria bacterium]|jgi:hypothetical protein|nr:DUF3237 domain-containing protein [Alphaproteobacteria bacterium]
MKLEPLMTLHVVSTPVEIGPGPQGIRTFFAIAGGTFHGARLRGRVLPHGGDWLLVDSEGVGRLDVRLTLETDDGAHIYMQYSGIAVINDTAATAMAQGGATAYGEMYFMTQPRFETGDARYGWLNRLVAVGEGRLVPSAAEYQVFELVHW